MQSAREELVHEAPRILQPRHRRDAAGGALPIAAGFDLDAGFASAFDRSIEGGLICDLPADVGQAIVLRGVYGQPPATIIHSKEQRSVLARFLSRRRGRHQAQQFRGVASPGGRVRSRQSEVAETA